MTAEAGPDGRIERIAKMDLNQLFSLMSLRPSHMLAALLVIIMPTALGAQTFENLDRLDSLVAITVGANVGEPGGPIAGIDRRLRLKPCPETPKIDGPMFGAAIVSCPQIGWRLRVPLSQSTQQGLSGQNRMVAQAAPEPETVVKKGDPVELVAGNGGFSVSRMMVAEEDGAVGDLISVREDRKSQPISARVERPGVVRAGTI